MHHSFQIAERFVSPQGEGVYAGTLMGFIRFTGCSVGKKVCHHCDTDFDRMDPWKGGGSLTLTALVDWAKANELVHVCFTGGEPFDQPHLENLAEAFIQDDFQIHIETSGTIKLPDWASHDQIWITMSPKPGWLKENITPCKEVKVIVGGLGNGPGWPTIDDALYFANECAKPTFLQPCNKKYEVDFEALKVVQDLQRQHPELRLSVQMHKLLKVR
jgi:organic radical activating enzyme